MGDPSRIECSLMEGRERRQGYDLNGNLILSKVGEGVFIVQGEKELFEAEFLCPAGAKSAAPAAERDQPAHSPAKPDLHRADRWRGEYAGEYAGWAGFYVGPKSNTPPEHSTGKEPAAIPGRPVQSPAHRPPRRTGRLLRRTPTEHPTRT
jgi:hypothetical protein